MRKAVSVNLKKIGGFSLRQVSSWYLSRVHMGQTN
jgi:hypothetical protein